MSDRLDIVRFIDAKVTASRRTVARSKQLADAAKDDLSTHEEWLEQHRQRAQEDQERHQRRLRRQHRLQSCKRVTLSVVLFVPSLCFGFCRGVARGLNAADRLIFGSCASIGRSTYAIGGWLVRSIAGTVAWTVRQLLMLGLWVAAVFWLCLSGLGALTRDIAVLTFGAGTRGLSWAGPRSRSLSHAAARRLSFGFSRLAVLIGSLGIWLRGRIERHIKELAARWQQDRARPAARQEPSLNPQRLQKAAHVRLRAEHDRLQARIHGLDRRYGSRVAAGGHPDGAEWAQLRQLALNARRLFEVQQAQALAAPAPKGNGESRPRQENGTMQTEPVHPFRAKHTSVEAPTHLAGRGQPSPGWLGRRPLRLRVT